MLPGSPADRRGTEFMRGPDNPLPAIATPLTAVCGPAKTSVPLCSAAAAPAGRLAIAAEERDVESPEFVPSEKSASPSSVALDSVLRRATASVDDRAGPIGGPADAAGLDGPLMAPFEFDREGSLFVLRPTDVLAGPAIIASPLLVPSSFAAAMPTSSAVVPTTFACRPSPRGVIAGCPFALPRAG